MEQISQKLSQVSSGVRVSMEEVKLSEQVDLNSNSKNLNSNSKKRGRPPGKWRGPKFRYKPVKWEPKFNQIVFDYLAVPGITHEELGKKYEFSPAHIGNILNSPQAGLIKESLSNNIVSRNQESIPILLATSAKKVVQRVADFMSDDDLYTRNPFAFIDRTLKIGAAIGAIKEDGNGVNNTPSVSNTQINIGDSAIKELAESLSIANKLRAG